MREYKTSILIGIIYISALVFLPVIRSVTAITAIFLALQFTFHGIFVLLGDKAAGIHRRFTETYFATIAALSLYSVSAGLYFVSFRHIF